MLRRLRQLVERSPLVADVRGKGLLIGMSLLIAMFPAISLVTPMFSIERAIGLFNTWPGLIIPYMTFSLPLAIYTLTPSSERYRSSSRRPPRSTARPRCRPSVA